ncbi:LysR family transcriptional regulator [Rhodococcus sp. D2-41]|uniref:LysR family transcriptional regulator n=1 Tax=Speluncibacter jeojiensis TaxID=2710754 RepID=UPI00240F7D57|nr:LysR family transcriptional regulator [Rhodococcus sp. D2-41]MDG3011122.1 LysR family transcriptional regulator [Rhodococcus sp. D2-41]
MHGGGDKDGAAARSLNLVQSAVSTSVAKLGTRLFDRTPTALRLTPAGSADNVAGVLDGSLDLALGGFDSVPAGVVVERLVEEPLVLVTAPGHPLAGGTFTADDLAHERIIDFPPGWGTRAVVDRVIPVRQSAIEVADQEFTVQLAASGFGVTLVPRSLAASDRRPIATAACADRGLHRYMGVAHGATITPTDAARAVLDALLESRR